jgi:RNA polymerase sigma-70 factor (ECF subfamily)
MIAIGGQEAFAQHWRQAEQSVRHGLARHVGRPSDRDDVLQEAALVAWRRRDDFVEGRSFAAWIYGIARRCRGLPRHGRSLGLDLAPPAPDPGWTMEDRDGLRTALARLPDGDVQLLRWVHVDGLPCAGIAKRLGLGPRSLAMRLARAEQRLRTVLTAAVD